jgi:hypothetical protein
MLVPSLRWDYPDQVRRVGEIVSHTLSAMRTPGNRFIYKDSMYERLVSTVTGVHEQRRGRRCISSMQRVRHPVRPPTARLRSVHPIRFGLLFRRFQY